MIRALCAFVVFILFMAIRPAQAGDDWEFNFRRCDVAIPIYGEGSENEDVDIHQGEDMYIVHLGAACASRVSSHEPQGNNWVSAEEAADDLGEAADEGTEDALKAE
jgi:hypothetical protein